MHRKGKPMTEKVKLILAKPDKIVKSGNYFGIILPGYPDNLTVIDGRAPSMVRLEPGIVQLLNEAGVAEEKIYIGGGVAQIVDNVCTVSVEKALSAKEISLQEASNRLQEIKGEENTLFYQIIVDDLTAFPDK